MFYWIIADAIKEAGKAPLIQLLDSYGGWPIITPDWNESSFDWKKTSSSLLTQFGIHIFFNITTTVDLDYTDEAIFFVINIFIATKFSVISFVFFKKRLLPLTYPINRLISSSISFLIVDLLVWHGTWSIWNYFN